MSKIKFLGKEIVGIEESHEYTGYDKDSTVTSYHTYYWVGTKRFYNLEDAKQFITEKYNPKAKRLVRKIDLLTKSKKVLQGAAYKIERRIETLQNELYLLAKRG